MNLTKEGLRARFEELTEQRDVILAVSAPLRAKRDAAVQAAREAEDALNAQIKEAETGLFEIDDERAMVVRALNGKTGAPQQ